MAKVDTTSTPEELAHEAVSNIEVIANVPELLFREVLEYKLRDVLPFVPALKRESVVQAKFNEMVVKMFESAYKSMQTQATLKAVKATNPELFNAPRR